MLLWGQLAPGGAMNLPWFTNSINANSLWHIFAAYEAFTADISLASGGYIDAAASASDSHVRVVGQTDLSTRHAYLWLRNSGYTWQQTLAGTAPTGASGTVTFAFPPGTYRADWWDTSTGTVSRSETVTATGGTLVLTVPHVLQTDIAVKIAPA
jgi:hypothetical protein